MNSTINTFAPSFHGRLILDDKTIIHEYLANEVLKNETLQNFAAQSDKDIFVSLSAQAAKSTTINHHKGKSLYKVFLSKEDDSFLGKIKHVFGLNKVSLSKNYHSTATFFDSILQPEHLKKITQKLNLK